MEVQVACVTGGVVQRGSHGDAGGMCGWGRGAEEDAHMLIKHHCKMHSICPRAVQTTPN